MTKNKLIVVLLLCCLWAKAQHTQCNCSSDSQQESHEPKECRAHNIMANIYKFHPEAIESDNAKQLLLRLKTGKEIPSSYTIPVVFHVFGDSFNNDSKVSVELIKEALHQTNMDFQGLTEGWENSIHPQFNHLKKKLNITFRLAQIDPDGNPTNGITFHPKVAGIGHDNGYNDIIKKHAWDNYKYMNIYIVRDLYSDGDYYQSGVAWPPNKWMSDNKLSRVVYNGSFLGSNTDKNFRKILTHEFGHWLNLKHTFNDGCYAKTTDADELIKGDYVLDTPPANKSKMRVDELNCRGELTNTQNFMNYTKDYAMFTTGQVDRMLAALQHETRKPLWQQSNLKNTGVDKAPDNAPMLTISSKTISESYNNDGTINDKLTIFANNGALFSNIKYVAGTHYKLSKLPAGLNLNIKYINDKKLEVSFSGSANEHNKVNFVNDITISFTKYAFASNFKLLKNSSIPNIKVLFSDPFTSYCVFKANWNPAAYINMVEFANISYSSQKEYHTNNLNSIMTNIKSNQTYQLKVRVNKGSSTNKDANMVRAWFDWNGNFVFEDSERLLSKAIHFSEADSDGNIEVSTNIKIPSHAVKGKTIGMRVYTHYIDPKASSTQGENPCGKVDSGEAEDFGLIILPENTKLEAKFAYSKSDITFNQPVLFSDISTPNKGKAIKTWKWSFPGGTPSSHIGQHPPKIYYQQKGTYSVELEITDEDNQRSTTRKKDLINSKYELCKPGVKYRSYAGITNVRLHTLNHTTKREAWHSDFSDSKYTELIHGETYDLSVTINKGKSAIYDWDQILIWIDWNYNSNYDENELVGLTKFKMTECDKDGNYTYKTKITVPATAKIQKTHMRTMVKYVDKKSTLQPCGFIDSGEIEDYGIIIKKGKTNVVADFIANENTPIVSEPTIFTNRSSSVDDDPIVKWEWKFKGGKPASSNKKSPDPVIYSKAGNYDVSLKVTSKSGKTNTKLFKNYIQAKYDLCNPHVNFSGYSYITNVKLGKINHKTGDSKMCISYYNSQQTDLTRGLTYNISVDLFTGRTNKGHSQIIEVWADWNCNGELEENEIVAQEKFVSPDKDKKLSFNFPFNVPAHAHIDKAILRVISYSNAGRKRCEKIHTGEAEDYAINIKKNPFKVTPDFIANKVSINVNEKINFTNTSFIKPGVKIKSWRWNFPGSNTSAYNGKNPPEVYYYKPGKYNVSLEVITADNKRTEHKIGYITVLYNACKPKLKISRYSYINSVSIGNMTNKSKSNAYTDYTNSKMVNVEPSQDIPLEIVVNTGASGHSDKLKLAAWIDWNRDANFDKGELFYHQNFIAGEKNKDHSFKTNIKIPSNIGVGKIIMRIIAEYHKEDEFQACGVIESGEVEDYALNVNTFSTSINSINDNNIIVYPTIFTDQVKLRNRSNKSIHRIAIYNTVGQKIFETIVNSKETSLPLSHFSKGIYILNVYSLNQKLQTFKIIKQ